MLVRCYPGSEQGSETVRVTQGLSPPLPPHPRWGARSWAWMPSSTQELGCSVQALCIPRRKVWPGGLGRERTTHQTIREG